MKKHCFVFVFQSGAVTANAFATFDDQLITKARIAEAQKICGFDESVLLNVGYLGFMTKEQFEGQSETAKMEPLPEPKSKSKAEPAPEPISKIFTRVQKILVDHLGVHASDVKMKSDLIGDLGADSLDVVELFMAFEEEFGIEIPDDDADGLTTVEDVVHFLQNRV